MKRHVVFGVLIILIMVVVEKSFAQDTTHNVDYYIDQCQNKYKELQRTIEETGRFFREFNGKDQSDQVASMTIKFFYDITCELRDMFYNEGIFLFLYKHIDSKSREVVSGFLDNALTLSLGNIGTNIRSSRYSLEQYKKGPVNRDRGRPHSRRPLTPPGIRDRTGRFM
jgi:hypothetical protein